MNPDELSAKNTESGHQKALFAWAAMAQQWGFEVANDMDAYQPVLNRPLKNPIPCLAWLHSIPNGGLRDARTAALMKAEGAKSGVADIFLPMPRYEIHGLYIEMKTASGKQSDQQELFETHCYKNDYDYHICRSWREAAKVIQDYLS